MMHNQVTIIIRSVGERTEALCKKLIVEQGVPEENVFIIRETPFSKAMRVGYQKGIDNGLKWTYCLDADVLLAEYAIRDMVNIAIEQPDEVFTISARMVDKFFNSARRVGNHLFKTSYLPMMIENIASYEKEGIRPETDAKNKILNSGGIEHKVDNIIGLHDFEQHYEDIARKTFVHANKHTEYLGDFVPYWKEKAEYDDDFKAALIGLSEGLKSFESIKIDLDIFDEVKALINSILEKKSNNIIGTYSSSQIEELIGEYEKKNRFSPPYSYEQIFKFLKVKIKFDVKKIIKLNE